MACAFVAALLPPAWRIAFFALTAIVAAVLAYSSAPAVVTAGGPEPAAPAPQPPQTPNTMDDVLRALPVGVIIIGEDSRIRAFNDAACEIFDVTAPRTQGRTLIEIVRSSELDRRLAATLREGTQEIVELTYSAAQERRLQVTTRVLRDPAGERAAVAIVTDLTRIRELESLRRDFVSNVSHDLRTPLTAVKLMVETLQSGVDARASEEFLTSIAQETERMIQLVEDLLDLARLETGKLELRLSAVDAGELCRQAVASHTPHAQSLGVELGFSGPPERIVVSADRDKLYQVLVNLLDNALRHTPAGGSVSVAATRQNSSVNIVVQDTGSGIPSTALPHIFERFYVVDPARARSRSGTGLGLAIVKHIIEAHGGSIEVESELGAGTTFRCVLRA